MRGRRGIVECRVFERYRYSDSVYQCIIYDILMNRIVFIVVEVQKSVMYVTSFTRRAVAISVCQMYVNCKIIFIFPCVTHCNARN